MMTRGFLFALAAINWYVIGGIMAVVAAAIVYAILSEFASRLYFNVKKTEQYKYSCAAIEKNKH